MPTVRRDPVVAGPVPARLPATASDRRCPPSPCRLQSSTKSRRWPQIKLWAPVTLPNADCTTALNAGLRTARGRVEISKHLGEENTPSNHSVSYPYPVSPQSEDLAIMEDSRKDKSTVPQRNAYESGVPCLTPATSISSSAT